VGKRGRRRGRRGWKEGGDCGEGEVGEEEKSVVEGQSRRGGKFEKSERGGKREDGWGEVITSIGWRTPNLAGAGGEGVPLCRGGEPGNLASGPPAASAAEKGIGVCPF